VTGSFINDLIFDVDCTLARQGVHKEAMSEHIDHDTAIELL
jgi:hypothetical protein